MKGKGLLIGVGVAGLLAGLYYYQRVKTTVQALTAKITGVAFDWTATKGSIFTKIYLKISVAVNNPNPEPITVSGIYLSLLYNGRSVANANRGEAFTIKPQSTTIAVITVSVDTLNLYSNVQNAYLALTNHEPIILNVLGGVNVPVGSIKINQTFKVSL